MRVLPVGPHAALVEVSSPQDAVGLAEWARGLGLAREVVPGAETVLFDGLADGAAGTEPLARALSGWRPTRAGPGRRVEIPVSYDGPDLAAVAAAWGCAADEVAARHQGTDFVAAFCGFAPGFAYLSGLAGSVPRLATPRTRVPAGAVALAGPWCGIYPRASPGGWQVIGQTDARLWDVTLAEPALLAPGTRVRFVAR
ncbi:5-oxoprolinase subunit B family protein [Nocardioides cynanchi]|uniref:5-oxoprolinase subunit B family protein n=1 Tax=Nocardioides cynanchi TaxID=2558918 RepID=UPI001247F960|nr:carboxyltransferase domain-containing protein [Nocardioides cynanchi]